jgi:DNA-binding MarR family transcriptional regulator
MTAIVDRLISEGKVRRLPDKKDRRIIRVEITDCGKEFIRVKKDEAKRSMIKKLSNLDDDDFTTLITALEEVNRIFLKIGR